MPAALPYIAAAASVASVVEQRKAGKAAEREAAASQKRAEIQNVRSVREQIRQARLAQSSMTNVAAQTGTMGSSAMAGGISSVGSQLAGNLGYMSDIAQQNTAIYNAQVAQIQASTNASIFGSIGNMAGSMYQGATGQTPFQAIGKKLS
jgi:hypothetical protein